MYRWIFHKFSFILAFTPGSNHKKGNKIGFYLCKRAQAKTIRYCTFYCMTNASNFRRGFTLDCYPKRVNEKMGTKMDINVCKSAKAKITYISYHMVLRIRNGKCKHLKFGFTPDSNPKVVTKRGNTIKMYLSKNIEAKPSGMSLFSDPQVWDD